MMGLLYKAGKNTLNQFCDIVKKNKDNGGDGIIAIENYLNSLDEWSKCCLERNINYQVEKFDKMFKGVEFFSILFFFITLWTILNINYKEMHLYLNESQCSAVSICMYLEIQIVAIFLAIKRYKWRVLQIYYK